MAIVFSAIILQYEQNITYTGECEHSEFVDEEPLESVKRMVSEILSIGEKMAFEKRKEFTQREGDDFYNYISIIRDFLNKLNKTK